MLACVSFMRVSESSVCVCACVRVCAYVVCARICDSVSVCVKERERVHRLDREYRCTSCLEIER
jgi:hypothetical protein